MSDHQQQVQSHTKEVPKSKGDEKEHAVDSKFCETSNQENKQELKDAETNQDSREEIEGITDDDDDETIEEQVSIA